MKKDNEKLIKKEKDFFLLISGTEFFVKQVRNEMSKIKLDCGCYVYVGNKYYCNLIRKTKRTLKLYNEMAKYQRKGDSN